MISYKGMKPAPPLHHGVEPIAVFRVEGLVQVRRHNNGVDLWTLMT